MQKEIRARDFRGIKQKSIGLIGARKVSPIFFNTRFGIHTFGLRFPIDVLILDSKNRVLKIKEHLQINRLFFWPIYYSKVIELPNGYIANHQIKVGNNIKLKLRK